MRRPSGLLLNRRMTAAIVFAIVLGYLFGSIPFGLVLTRVAGKGDVRAIGSGNIGATNVLRTGSKLLAAFTLILDCLKATAAIVLAHALFEQGFDGFGPAARAAAAGAMVGHLYPIWLKFRGGKGVATFLGILIPLLPMAAVIYAAVWVLLMLTIRISSVAGISAAISAPITAAILKDDSALPMLLGFALLVIWKHRENILRLKNGNEPRIGSGPSPGA